MVLTISCLRLHRISLWIYDCSNIRILLYGFILLTVLGQCAQAKLPDDNGLKTLSQKFADRLTEVVRFASGSDIVEKSYQAAVSSSKMTLSSIDGQQIVTDVAQKLGDLLGKKITALQAAVQHAEKLTETYEWNPELKADDVSYVDSKNFNYSDPAVEYSDLLQTEVLMENSSVHIPVDIYAGDVEILNSLSWTAGIDEVWRENHRQDSDLRWQYFGSQTGVLRIFPGAPWRGSTFGKHKVDMYDVRRRPWYTQGASSPKDLLILIDRSGSSHGQALALMKHSIKSIIDMLNENDFVNVAEFADVAKWVGCFDTLVQANQRNKRILKTRVDNITANGVASYTAGFKFAFEQLIEFLGKENRSEGEGALCNPIIMFLTDGGNEVPEAVFEQFNSDKRIRIFTFAVGPIAYPIVAVRKIGCINRGDFYQIPAMGAIRSKVQEYVDIVSQSVSPMIKHEDLLQWSRSYNDEMKLELVTSVTLPVFNRSNVGNETIVGVMGIDVPTSEMLELVPKEKLGPGGYTFAINSNGYLIFHPDLKGATPGINDPPSVDLVEVEEETEEMLKIRKDMIDQVAGTVTVTGYVPDDDDHHAEMKRRTYWYAPVPNSPFSIAVVIPEDMKSFVNNVPKVPFDEGIKSLQSDLEGAEIHFPFGDVCENEMLDLTEENMTRNQYIVEFLRFNRSQCDEKKLNLVLLDISLTASLQIYWQQQRGKQQQHRPNYQPLDQPIDIVNAQPNEQPNDQPNDQLNDQSHNQSTEHPSDQPVDYHNDQPSDQLDRQSNDQPINQSLESRTAEPGEEMQDELKLYKEQQSDASEGKLSLPVDQTDDSLMMTFVTTNNGLTRLHASENISNSSIAFLTVNPRDQIFYKRSVYNNVWMFSVHNDDKRSNDSAAIIMATKSITVLPSGFTTAVVGVQMESERLRSLLVETMPQCGDLNLRCFLVDDGGLILYANEEFDPLYMVGSFLGRAEPLLMQRLINESIFISQRTIDFQGVCKMMEGGASSAIRLIPNLLYELLTFQWWSSASTWTYLSVAGLINWMTSSVRASAVNEGMSTLSSLHEAELHAVTDSPHQGTPATMSSFMEIELEYLKRPKVHSCIRALNAYHLNQLLPSQGQAGSTDKQRLTGHVLSPCNNCSRRFGVARVPDTNIILAYIDIDCDQTRCELLPKLKFLPEEIADPISEGGGEGNCTAEFRYRRRPACYDINPNVNMTLETHCRASVLSSLSLHVITLISLIISSTVLMRHRTHVLPL